jgi:hypothetical protein
LSAACFVKIQIQAGFVVLPVVLCLAEPPSHTHVVAADSSISALNPFPDSFHTFTFSVFLFRLVFVAPSALV